jgi:hypothetical protein
VALIAGPLEHEPIDAGTDDMSPCRVTGCTTTATTTGLCVRHEAVQLSRRAIAGRRHHVVALPALSVSRPTWHDLAACRGRGPAAFYAERSSRQRPGENGTTSGRGTTTYRQALQLCGVCPVRAQCAEAGAHEAHGVWGGQTPAERGFGVRPSTRTG